MQVMKSRRMSWAEHVASMKFLRNTNSILVGKTKETQTLGRAWPRLDCNTESYIYIHIAGVRGWSYMAQEVDQFWACVNTLTNQRFLKLCEFIYYILKYFTPCSSSFGWYVKINIYNARRN
jgi:hypothetical protein